MTYDALMALVFLICGMAVFLAGVGGSRVMYDLIPFGPTLAVRLPLNVLRWVVILAGLAVGIVGLIGFLVGLALAIGLGFEIYGRIT